MLYRPVRYGCLEDCRDAVASLVPDVVRELVAVAYDEVLETVCAGPGQLLIVCRQHEIQIHLIYYVHSTLNKHLIYYVHSTLNKHLICEIYINFLLQ